MPHELEQMADGSTAFATARVPAWHRLGYVADGAMTAEELMTNAQLGGWDVRLGLGAAAVVPTGRCQACKRAVGAKHTQKCTVPADADRDAEIGLTVTAEDTADVHEAPGFWPIVRTNPVSKEIDTLGMAQSPHYPVLQPEEVAEFGEALIDQSGAIWETGGSLRGGRDIFMTLQLPQAITIGGVDEVGLYLALLNNYSASGHLEALTTPVRVVCANTQHAALHNFRSRYQFRHGRGMRDKMAQVAEAKAALKMHSEYTEAFKAEAESMINTKMDLAGFEDLIKAVWPEKWTKPSDEWRQPQVTQWDTLRNLFTQADTQENIRGTVWAGFQAVTEWYDWEIPVAGMLDTEEQNRIRSARNFDGQYADRKQAAFTLCRDIVAAK